MTDHLAAILTRKRKELARRASHRSLFDPPAIAATPDRRPAAIAALTRGGGAPRVIAEIKFRSPSEGSIRAWRAGEGARVARAYEAAGAAAISVLADRAGFGGGVLEVRRVARVVGAPVLFKEFVLDERQLDLARVAGASLVLLLVRALSTEALSALVRGALARGLEPLVEAADEREVEAALATDARVVGVNARDLSSFTVDPARAARALRRIPSGRRRVYMSGVSSAEDLARAADAGADAVLVGTALMRAADPGARLSAILRA